jgi:hypothetical protein
MLAARECLIGARPNKKTTNLLNEAMVDFLPEDAQKDLLVGLVEFAETLDLNNDVMFEGETKYGYKLEIAVSDRSGFEADLYWNENEFKCYRQHGFEYENIAELTGAEANSIAKRIANLACKWASGLSF